MFEYSKLIDIDKAITSISKSDTPVETTFALVAGFAAQDKQLALDSILRRASGSRKDKVVDAVLEAGAKADSFFSQAVVNAGSSINILRSLHTHGANISLNRVFSEAALINLKREFDLENKIKGITALLSP